MNARCAIWAKRIFRWFIPPSMAALIGAGVGGWTTAYVVGEDTRIKMKERAYSAYLEEAVEAWLLSNDGKYIEEGSLRFNRATSSLTLTASEDIVCRAREFLEEIASENPDLPGPYERLRVTMRAELTGETARLDDIEECSFTGLD